MVKFPLSCEKPQSARIPWSFFWVKKAFTFKYQDLVVNSGFQKEAQKFLCNIENHSSGAQTKLMFGNEMKINNFSPRPVNDLSSAVD